MVTDTDHAPGVPASAGGEREKAVGPVAGLVARLPTDVAIAALVVIGGMVLTMWALALNDGVAGSAFGPASGNHGVWRHHRVMRGLYEHVLLYAHLIALPAALLGGFAEGS